MNKSIYILIDFYAPDGAKIYGVYSTMEKAKEMKRYYGFDDNEFGKANYDLEIREERLWD